MDTYLHIGNNSFVSLNLKKNQNTGGDKYLESIWKSNIVHPQSDRSIALNYKLHISHKIQRQ